jgi:hypothetical protein
VIDTQQVYELFLSNVTMGVAIAVAIVAMVASLWSPISVALEERDRLWPMLLRLFAAWTTVVIVWISLVDNWLQLVTEPYRLAQRWNYQRVVFDPVDADLRRITLVLVAISAIIAAALFARYIGGYALQIAVLIPATFGWFALFIFRQRFDMIVNTIPDSDDRSVVDILGFLGFWVVRTGLGIVSIAITWLLIVLVIAPVVTLVLDVLRIRSPKVTNEAGSFYAALEANAAEHRDVPLSSRWKPIRSHM